MFFPFHCNTVPCTKPKWIKQGWLLRNLNSDYLLVPYIWLKFLLQETEKSKLWINYKVFANTYWNFKMLQVHQGVQKHVLPSTLGSCWHIWEPHCWSRESTHHHQTMKMKASPPWSLAQPFPEEREARRQLQLGRNTYDPSLHILPPYVIFQRQLQRIIAPVQTWVSWQSLHTHKYNHFTCLTQEYGRKGRTPKFVKKRVLRAQLFLGSEGRCF